MSFTGRIKDFFRRHCPHSSGKLQGTQDNGSGDRGVTAVPATATPVIDQSPQQGGVQDGIEWHVPPSSTSGKDEHMTPANTDGEAKEPQLPVTASTAQHTSKDSPSYAAQALVPPVDGVGAYAAAASAGAKEPQPVTKSIPQQDPISNQKLWDDAYDLLELEEDTAKVVEGYRKTLAKVLVDEKLKDLRIEKSNKKFKAEIVKELKTLLATGVTDTSAAGADDIPADLKNLRAYISDQLKDRTKRQMYLEMLVEQGKKKVKKASQVTEVVGNFAQTVLSVKPVADTVMGYVPQTAPAALPWAGVCIGLQILSNPANEKRSNLKGISYVATRMDWYCALTRYLLNKDYIDPADKSVDVEAVQHLLEQRILDLYKAILLYQMRSVNSYYRCQSFDFLLQLAKWDAWDDSLEIVTHAEEVLRNDSNQYNNEFAKLCLGKLVESAKGIEKQLGNINQTLEDFIALQKQMAMDNKDRKYLDDLFLVDPQSELELITSIKGPLLDDVYDWILETDQYKSFTNWADDESGLSPCRLLWIKGNAGTGKTMLLIGIIRKLSDQSSVLARHVAHFFCQYKENRQDSATAILRSLIWMLLLQQPHIITSMRERSKISLQKLLQDSSAFYTLSSVLREALKELQSPVYFIIDALDECSRTQPGLDQLIELISDCIGLSDKVRWLVSSRPDVDVPAKLKNPNRENPDNVWRTVELDDETLKIPVKTYIKHKLCDLDGKPGYNPKTLKGVSDEVNNRAENTFLWVWHVFKVLGTESGWHAPKIIKEIPSDLSKLYAVLWTRIKNRARRDLEYCKQALAAISLAYRELSLSELLILAGLPENVDLQVIVGECGSFLTIKNETVYLVHKTAKEYLEDHQSEFRTEAVHGHMDIVRKSIDALSKVYNREHWGFETRDQKLPLLAPIRYSCVFWLDHLCADHANSQNSDYKCDLSDEQAIFDFLKAHFLHWLESLSLLRRLSGGVFLMKKLLAAVKSNQSERSEFASFLEDAEAFVGCYGSIIERDHLQTYGAALTFCPIESKMKKLFWDKQRPPIIKTAMGIDESWDRSRQTLEGHTGPVLDIAFSPKEQTLASASRDGTARLWDTTIGVCRKTIPGYGNPVNAVAFSPDGQTLALASLNTVRLWDMATDLCRMTLEGPGLVDTIAFSPDGKTLASGSVDGRVQFADGRKPANSFAFSPDGKTLAVGSLETVRLWMATSAHSETAEGPGNVTNAVTFSPDGKTLESNLDEMTVRFWDTAKGTFRNDLKGSSGGVFTVAFSPDSNTLASNWAEKSLKLWDIAKETGRELPSFEVYAMAFSSDGKFLAAAEFNGTVHLWDYSNPENTVGLFLEGHTSQLSTVAFSYDSRTLASASYDCTVRLWDMATRAKPNPKGHRGPVTAVTFSPNGNMLASASDDKTVRLWDVTKGTCQPPFEGHTKSISAVAFSPDGKMLASASFDGTARLWNIATGVDRTLEKRYQGWVCTVAFSPDGETLVSASVAGEVLLWDTTNGKRRETLQGPQAWVYAATLSSEGKYLALATGDGEVWLWNLAKSRYPKVLKTLGHSVKLVAFSSDGKKLATASGDGTVRLWITSLGTYDETFRGHESIQSLSFSDDGRFLQTDRGLINLDDSPSASTHHDDSTCAVFIDDQWIIRDGKNFMWLPPNYRAKCWAFCNNVLVIGQNSGRVTFLEMQK